LGVKKSVLLGADNWSHEEPDAPLYADRRNFYKVEKWSSDACSGPWYH
jgi:hypothetical protein